MQLEGKEKQNKMSWHLTLLSEYDQDHRVSLDTSCLAWFFEPIRVSVLLSPGEDKRDISLHLELCVWLSVKYKSNIQFLFCSFFGLHQFWKCTVMIILKL